MTEIDKGEPVFDWALKLSDSLADWRAEVRPFYFEPRGVPLVGVATTKDEQRILASLKDAQDDVASRHGESRKHLAEVWSTWKKIRERRDLAADSAKLAAGLRQQLDVLKETTRADDSGASCATSRPAGSQPSTTRWRDSRGTCPTSLTARCIRRAMWS